MAHPLINKDTAISLSVVIVLAGAVWWAATVQSDLSYVKRDVAEIKAVLMKASPVVAKK